MSFLFNFIIGIFIGFGAILPGVSSGVFCVIFGIYEKILNSVTHFFKDIKNNFFYLLPIALGTVIGIILFGNIIKFLFTRYTFPVCYTFIGLILGTVPSLFKQASPSGIVSIKKIIPMFISFFIGIILIIIEKHFSVYSSMYSNNFIYLVFSGFFMAVGLVIPGVSSTIILMCLGVYTDYLSAVASINLSILIPLAIGCIFGGVIWLKIITILLSHYHEITFYSIIGFTLGSIFVLFPGFLLNTQGFICIVLLILSIYLSYRLSIFFS